MQPTLFRPLHASPFPKARLPPNVKKVDHSALQRAWIAGPGQKFKQTRPGERNWLGETPFPKNPTFNPPPPIPQVIRDKIFSLFTADPRVNTPRRLAAEFGVSIARAEGIIRLGKNAEGMAQQLNLVRELEPYLHITPHQRIIPQIDEIPHYSTTLDPADAGRMLNSTHRLVGQPVFVMKPEADIIAGMKAAAAASPSSSSSSPSSSSPSSSSPSSSTASPLPTNRHLPQVFRKSRKTYPEPVVTYTRQGQSEETAQTWQFADTSNSNTLKWHMLDLDKSSIVSRLRMKLGDKQLGVKPKIPTKGQRFYG